MSYRILMEQSGRKFDGAGIDRSEPTIDQATDLNIDYSFIGAGDHSLRVLLMDDNEAYLQQMTRRFSPKTDGISQVQLTTCNDPVLGIAHLEEATYDMLLIDYHMPQVDGIKLFEWLRHDRTHPNQEIFKVMVTADPNVPQTTRLRIVNTGARVVSKSMSTEDLRLLVSEVMLRNSSAYRRSVV